MEQPVNDVELEFPRQRGPELSRLALSGWNADEDFTVLKCDHISRPGLIQELPVQTGHPPVGNQQNEDFVWEILGLPPSTKPFACLKSAPSEPLERSHIDPELPL